MKKISIVDYGAGNILSVKNALNFLGYDCIVTSDRKYIQNSDLLILPGVGSFYEAMIKLNTSGISDAIKEAILVKKKKILGICLGMQLLSELGTEDKQINGLGLIKAKIISMKYISKLNLPHIGFNSVESEYKDGLYKNLNKMFFYFIHSYYMNLYGTSDFKFGYCNYGSRFIASFENKNIFGTQFHPEKSQKNGLQILENFIKLND